MKKKYYDIDDKFFLADCYLRANLLLQVEQTDHYDNDGLVNFIINEMSTEDVIDYTFRKFDVVNEQQTESSQYSDIEREKNLIAANDSNLGMLLHISLAQWASGDVMKRMTNGKPASSVKGRVGRGAAGFILSIALMAASQAIAKVLLVMVSRLNNQCRKACKKELNNQPDVTHRVAICEQKCRLGGINRIIAKLKSEVARCNQTSNPEACSANLIKQIGRYNEMLKNEQQKLQKLMAQPRKTE